MKKSKGGRMTKYDKKSHKMVKGHNRKGRSSRRKY